MKPASTSPNRRAGELPAPIQAAVLYGHADAEAEFLEAYRKNRTPHAWLICGPRGIGKATLAWRIARFMLVEQAEFLASGSSRRETATSLDTPEDHPVVERIKEQAEPTAVAIERRPHPETGKMQKSIAIDDIRKWRSFFNLTSADGMPLIAVVDAADDLNRHSANAMLQFLEEPPPNSYIFLVSHASAGLLPTIRSRCRKLSCNPLSATDMEQALVQLGMTEPGEIRILTELAEGSVRDAVRLQDNDGINLYGSILELMLSAPGLDRSKMLQLVEELAGNRANARAELGLDLILLCIARLARAASAGGSNFGGANEMEVRLFRKLAAVPRAASVWASAHGKALAEAKASLMTNINPAALVINLFLELDRAAAEVVV